MSRLVVGRDCLSGRRQCCQSASTDSRGETYLQLRPPTILVLGDKISLVLVKNCMVLVKRKLGLVKNKLGLGEKKSLVCIVIITQACQLLSEDKQIRPERLEALVADTKLQPNEVILFPF